MPHHNNSFSTPDDVIQHLFLHQEADKTVSSLKPFLAGLSILKEVRESIYLHISSEHPTFVTKSTGFWKNGCATRK